jgi:hypothetical protein
MQADRNAWWVSFAGVLVVLLLPLFLTAIPPLLDYPNHLARMFVLKHLPDDPVLSQMYEAKWRILPNIGMDLLIPPLLKFLSLEVAGKLFVILALVLPTLGAVMLHRALFGVWSYWSLSTALVAYNTIFLLGFLNFLVGLGLALLAGAIWYRQREQGLLTKRIFFGSIFALIIFFCHLIAWAFFGLLLLSIEVYRAWIVYRGGNLSPRRLLESAFAILLPFILPFVLYLSAPIGNETGQGVGILQSFYKNIAHFRPGRKMNAALSVFMNYSLPLDLAVVLVVCLTLFILYVKKRLAISPHLVFAVVVLVVSFPFIPFVMTETAFVDYRLPLFAIFLVFAGTEPKNISRRKFRLILGAIGFVFLVRFVVIGMTWTAHNADLADLRRIIAPIEPGSSVLVVQTRNGQQSGFLGTLRSHRWRVTSRFLSSGRLTFWHLPALIVIERKAFFPLLFTHPWKQLLQVRPAYRDRAVYQGTPPFIDELSTITPRALANAPYLRNWQGKYDYLLVLLPTRDPQAVASLLEWGDPVDSSDIAALYRIRHGS